MSSLQGDLYEQHVARFGDLARAMPVSNPMLSWYLRNFLNAGLINIRRNARLPWDIPDVAGYRARTRMWMDFLERL